MELQVGVKVLLKNPDGKYLLVRRSTEKYSEVGAKWDMVGGRIGPGSTLMENLAREIHEETGLEMSGIPRLVTAQDILRVPSRHIIRLTYVGEAEGEVALNEEHDEHKWFAFDEIRELKDLDKYLKEVLEAGLIS